MKDKASRIIYVGKAKNLRSRVRQYFGSHDTRYQIEFLMKKIVSIDFLETHNEKEALLLENSLIKKHKPKYNVFLRDDKTYQGLKITLASDYPRLVTTRRVKKDGAKYYGPFTSADSLYKVKEFIDQHFLLRTCSDHEFSNRTRPCLEYQIKRCSAPCVDYVSKSEYAKQIKTVRKFLEGKNRELQKVVKEKMKSCSQKEEFEEAARHRDLLQSMSSVLEEQHVSQLSFEFVDVLNIKRMEDKIGIAVLMVRNSELIDSKYYVFKSLESNEDFLNNFITQYYSENSFIPKEIIVPCDLDKSVLESLLKERAGRRTIIRKAVKGERKDLLKLADQNLHSHFLSSEKKEKDIQIVLETMQKKLCLNTYPEKIECYDISNISGKMAVASLVSFNQGKQNKDGYRRFKINCKDTPDDYAMMNETLTRRFKKKVSEWGRPDLVIVDGGKGQLNMALKVLEELDVTGIHVVGIAKGKGEGVRARGVWQGKKEEEIYLPGRKNPVTFKAGTPELLLLQRIRDEAHRFAITYHRKLREKALTESPLDGIAGLGPKRKKLLLKTFGSLKAVLEAKPEELLKIKGMTPQIVNDITQLRSV